MERTVATLSTSFPSKTLSGGKIRPRCFRWPSFARFHRRSRGSRAPPGHQPHSPPMTSRGGTGPTCKPWQFRVVKRVHPVPVGSSGPKGLTGNPPDCDGCLPRTTWVRQPAVSSTRHTRGRVSVPGAPCLSQVQWVGLVRTRPTGRRQSEPSAARAAKSAQLIWWQAPAPQLTQPNLTSPRNTPRWSSQEHARPGRPRVLPGRPRRYDGKYSVGGTRENESREAPSQEYTTNNHSRSTECRPRPTNWVTGMSRR